MLENYENIVIIIGKRASGQAGKRASGQAGKRASLSNRRFVVAALVVSALSSLASLEQSQAQLYIDVYPSQDTPTNSIWIFSGSSSIGAAGTLRTSGNHSSADGWQTERDIYAANHPSNAQITLSPLSSSTNTMDIESVRVRTAGVWGSGSPFANSATNTPTITLGTTPVSRTINRMFMNNVNIADNIGIRVSSGHNYGSFVGQASSWTGSGLLINKPVSDFVSGNVNNWANLNPNFTAYGATVTLRFHSGIIPEPEEYALVFGLFALGFVLFRRHLQKKKRQTQAITS